MLIDMHFYNLILSDLNINITTNENIKSFIHHKLKKEIYLNYRLLCLLLFNIYNSIKILPGIENCQVKLYTSS